MKKLLLALLTSALMVSCAEGLVEESHVSDTVAGGARTLTATFEGNDTRIQLNEELNTVWTNGDEVSVFYLSNVNTKFVYEGETGARTATLSETTFTANTKEFDTENIIQQAGFCKGTVSVTDCRTEVSDNSAAVFDKFTDNFDILRGNALGKGQDQQTGVVFF